MKLGDFDSCSQSEDFLLLNLGFGRCIWSLEYTNWWWLWVFRCVHITHRLWFLIRFPKISLQWSALILALCAFGLYPKGTLVAHHNVILQLYPLTPMRFIPGIRYCVLSIVLGYMAIVGLTIVGDFEAGITEKCIYGAQGVIICKTWEGIPNSTLRAELTWVLICSPVWWLWFNLSFLWVDQRGRLRLLFLKNQCFMLFFNFLIFFRVGNLLLRKCWNHLHIQNYMLDCFC